MSNNVVFNALARRVGPQKVADAARAAGITSPLDDPNEGIALGNKEVSTLELASAYATIAGGRRVAPAAPGVAGASRPTAGCSTRRAPRASGGSPSRSRATSPRPCSPSPTATGSALRGGGRSRRRPARCSRAFPGENNDAWMAGFTPQLAASVWMGTDRNSPIRTASGDPISGRTLPGEVWQGFMADGAAATPRRSRSPRSARWARRPSDAPPNAAATPTAPPADRRRPRHRPEPDPEAPDGVTEPRRIPAATRPTATSPHGRARRRSARDPARRTTRPRRRPADRLPSASVPAAGPGDRERRTGPRGPGRRS